nr:hypothetical protein [Shinella lacus]
MVDRQFLLPVCAAIAIFGHDGVWAAAVGAFDESAQEIGRAMGAVEAVRLRMIEQGFDLELPLLHLRPEFIVDDAQLGDFGHDPFALGVHAGFPLFRFRVLAELATIEDKTADICLVVQNAGTSLLAAADCRVTPSQSSRAWNLRHANVEVDRHLLGRAAEHILLENPSDDFSLLFIDFAQTRDAIAAIVVYKLRLIAIRNAAGGLAFANGRLHAFARLVARLLDHIVTDDRPQAEFHIVDRRRVLDCPEFDAAMT